MQGSHNICIGPRAGESLTTESYQFCLTNPCDGPEFKTTMTPEEYEVINRVICRAIKEKEQPKLCACLGPEQCSNDKCSIRKAHLACKRSRKEALEWVMGHEERCNGEGYGCQIISMVDEELNNAVL